MTKGEAGGGGRGGGGGTGAHAHVHAHAQAGDDANGQLVCEQMSYR